MIHDGLFFDASGKINVGIGANLDILLQFPAGSIGHLTMVEYNVEDAPCDILFYENTTFSAAGTAITPKNHNRLSTKTSDITMTHTPTITDAGDLLHTKYIPAAGGPGQQAGGLLVPGEDQEWVLGNGVNYLWRLTNNSGGAIDVGFHFNGYHIDYPS